MKHPKIHSWTIHRDSLGHIAILDTDWGDYALRFALDARIDFARIETSWQTNRGAWHRWDRTRDCFRS